jgi:hypothetical protein
VISARICVANGSSASTRPAANAPSDGENPSAWALHAEPRLAQTAITTGSSRVPADDAAVSSCGSKYRAIAHETVTNATTRKERNANSLSSAVGPKLVDSASVMMSVGITATSCISRMPIAFRPALLSSRARSVSSRRTTAVLLMANASPSTIAARESMPKPIAAP